MSSSNFKVLVVDDDNVGRKILENILIKQGYEVFSAVNGQEAIEQYETHRPDLIFLDILMPVKNGHEAAEEICKLAENDFLKIIFITAVTDYEQLKRCIDVGGDDFLTKPYNNTILKAKVVACERMKEMHSLLQSQREALYAYEDQMIREQEVAKGVFDNIAHTGCLTNECIKYTLSPKSVFNGDLLLAAFTPSGVLNVMLGDFTGHGLPASIGAIPTSEIFYSMTNKGFPMQEIVYEINRKLNVVLPMGFFCVGSFLEINEKEGSLGYYNCGLPGALIYDPKSRQITELASTNIPLGIINRPEYEVSMRYLHVESGQRVYLFSDGIIEAANQQGEMFGEERIHDILCKGEKPEHLYQDMIDGLYEYLGTDEADDDVTLIEIVIDPKLVKDEKENHISLSPTNQSNWSFQYSFDASFLKHNDPLPIILQSIMQCVSIETHRAKIYTILTELYRNALDHGLLGLSAIEEMSSMKPHEYQEKRETLLNELSEGEIEFNVDVSVEDQGGSITISLNDSGQGFNYQEILDLGEQQNKPEKGIGLVQSLCDSLNFAGEGNKVNATYKW